MSREFKVTSLKPNICDFCSRKPRDVWGLWPAVSEHYLERWLGNQVPLKICRRCAWRIVLAIFSPRGS